MLVKLDTTATRFERGDSFEVSRPMDAYPVMCDVFSAKLEKYTNPLSPEYKPYHNESHTAQLVDNVKKLYEDFAAEVPYWLAGLSEEDWNTLSAHEQAVSLELVKAYQYAVVMGHDSIQNGTINAKGMLVRNRGVKPDQNEGASAEEIISVLDTFTYSDGEKVFKDFSSDRVRADVFVTMPEFDPTDPAKRIALKQPYLTPKTSAQGVIMALVDLKSSALSADLEGPMRGGDAEFFELNPWAFEVAQNIDTVSTDALKKFKTAALGWLAGQPGFFSYQKEDLARILSDGTSDQPPIISDSKVREVLKSTFKAENMSAVVAGVKDRHEKWARKFDESEESPEQIKALIKEMYKNVVLEN